MSLELLFLPSCVTHGLRVTGKKQLLQELVTLAGNNPHLSGLKIPNRDLLAAVLERERLGTTGIGAGVGIPHARVKGLTRMVCAFALLAAPINFDSVDDRPVDIAVLLLAPEDAGTEHLRALAQVSRVLRREDFRTRLRSAPSAEAAYLILTEGRSTAAAE